MLRSEQLSKHFGGVIAVDNVSFCIETGSITGLIGPNGAGKTTLFNLFAGAIIPTSGRILCDDEDITGLATHQIFHRGIVRTFQIPQEFGRLTVLENLMVVPPAQPGEQLHRIWTAAAAVRNREREVRERAEEVLEFLSIAHLRDDLAQTLSGGQKKLLELGRTMMTDARVVLLDEPGAGVNPTLMGKIADTIRSLNQERGYTFCIIEHDMDLITSLCDPVIVLAEGRVLASGSMAQIRRNPKVLDAYMGGEDAPAP